LHRIRLRALWLLVAAAAGGCGDGINTAHLPETLDLNRLIGMRLPGTPSCAFENKARTFLRTGGNQVQGIDIQCARATAQVVVFGVDRTPPLADGELRCDDLERSGPGFGCGVSRDMLTVATQVKCVSQQQSADSRCDAKAAARGLMARLVELLSGLSEEAPPRFDQSLPSSIDLKGFEGVRLPGTPTCTFGSEVLGYPEPGTGEIDLRCSTRASAKVTIEDGTGGVSELVECRLEASEYRCALRQGGLTVRTFIRCPSGRSGHCHVAARALITRLLDFLSTIPHRPCRPCGEREPGPQRVRLPTSIYGEGLKHLGSLEIPVDSIWSYSGTGPPGFRVTTTEKQLFESPELVDEFPLPAGSYRGVRLRARGHWTLTIRASAP